MDAPLTKLKVGYTEMADQLAARDMVMVEERIPLVECIMIVRVGCILFFID